MSRVCSTTRIDPPERIATTAPPRSEETGVLVRLGRGFSLVELVIVVAIVGVVALLATPRFTEASEGRRLDLAHTRIDRALDAWAERARLSSADMLAAFDQDAETLSLYDGRVIDDRDLIETIRFGETPYRVDLRTESGSVKDTQIALNAHGLTDDDLSVEIRVGDLTRTIGVP